MVAITYVEHDGTEHAVDVDEQMSLMEGATLNMVPGVEGMCGGICSCATCHCIIDDAWIDKVGKADEVEMSIMESAIEPSLNSRLSCQIKVTDELDGIVIHVPESEW